MCVGNYAVVVFLDDVVGKSNVVRNGVFIEGDNFLVGIPVLQRTQAGFADFRSVSSSLQPQSPDYAPPPTCILRILIRLFSATNE